MNINIVTQLKGVLNGKQPVSNTKTKESDMKFADLLGYMLEECNDAEGKSEILTLFAGDLELNGEILELLEDLPVELQEILVSIFNSVHIDIQQQNNEAEMQMQTDFLIESIEQLITQIHQFSQTDVSTVEQKYSMKEINSILNNLQALYSSINQQNEKKSELQQKLTQLTRSLFDERAILKSAFSRAVTEQGHSQGKVLPNKFEQVQHNQQHGSLMVTDSFMNKAHQFSLHLGGKLDQPNMEQFIRQFQNILGRSSFLQSPNGLNQLSIKLFPEHLGRLDVKITQLNGKMVAQLMTTTLAAKETIESQLHLLKQAFSAQNIQVEKIEITQQHQQQLSDSNKEGQNNQEQEKPAKDKIIEEETEVETNSFSDMLEETFNTKV